MKVIFRIVIVLVLLLIANHFVHAQGQGIEVTQVIDIGYHPSPMDVARSNDDEFTYAEQVCNHVS